MFRVVIPFFKIDKELASFKRQLKNVLGFRPTDILLYKTALSHRSVREGADENNERLEFLGDAVLGLVIADFLFKKFPYKPEGYLTDLRSKMVSRQQLNSVATKMGVEEVLAYNKQDKLISKATILGNALEALVGAIYVDRGFSEATKFILGKIVTPYLDIDEVEERGFNYKSHLMEWGQRHKNKVTYSVLEHGNRQNPFTMILLIDGEEFTRGTDLNKKNAEKKAAQAAFEKLKLTKHSA